MDDAALRQALGAMSPKALQAMRAGLEQRIRESGYATYRPYGKQKEFHAKGASHRERLLRAGNQQGKTFCAGNEAAYHLTGEYPEWWQGRRWDRPVMVWAAGDTAEMTRDNPQRVLLGPVGEFGTGSIPKAKLGTDYGLATGVADLYDYVKVKHVSGGWSTLRFKYYAQGRQKWQGPPVDFVWFDEEPPEEIYSEGLARTIATKGIIAMTFTPLLGMSSVVRRFLMSPSPDCSDTNMVIEDAEHIAPEERARIIASFLPHERDARARGIPILGSGRVFPIPEEAILVEPFSIPSHWFRLKAMDFGWDHPTACVWLAEDRDNETVYVYRVYRRSEAPVVVHAAAINGVDSWAPVAWPHDGNNDTAAGPNLASQYRAAGVKMIHEHAMFPEEQGTDKPTSRVSVEAGVQLMYTMMEAGKWKVFNTCQDWLEEFRLYHRKDGKIVKEVDDAISASRYGLMSLRYAIQQKKPEPSWKGRLAKMRRESLGAEVA